MSNSESKDSLKHLQVLFEASTFLHSTWFIWCVDHHQHRSDQSQQRQQYRPTRETLRHRSHTLLHQQVDKHADDQDSRTEHHGQETNQEPNNQTGRQGLMDANFGRILEHKGRQVVNELAL